MDVKRKELVARNFPSAQEEAQVTSPPTRYGSLPK